MSKVQNDGRFFINEHQANYPLGFNYIASKNYAKEYQEELARASDLESFLVSACLILESKNIDLGCVNILLSSWWNEKKAEIAEKKKLEDEKARKAEVKKQAISKLSQEEREVLGLTS